MNIGHLVAMETYFSLRVLYVWFHQFSNGIKYDSKLLIIFTFEIVPFDRNLSVFSENSA
jgi:hypothetical protein